MLRRSGGTLVVGNKQRQDFTSTLAKSDTRSLLVGRDGQTDEKQKGKGEDPTKRL